MKRCWIEYTPTRTSSPLTYWVHLAANGKPWYRAERFEPPLQPVVGGKGYPRFFVEFNGFTFCFASLAEVQACIAVLAQKHLPTTLRLSAGHHVGPNGHWLSRLPKQVKPWVYRARAVAYLRQALLAFERELGR